MKKLINILLPYYTHNNVLTSNLTLKKKAAFFFFYFDRYVYSPLLQTLLRGKNVIEKNRSKNISTKAVADKFGSACESSHDVGNRTGNNGKNKNDDEMGETNAIWPEGISYVTPLEIKKKEQLKDKKFNVIYIGHMSILIQTANFNILVDPVLSTRIGLFNLMGVKRTIKAGISFEHLPSIDFILLSNNRFDTMDKSTLKKIVLRDNSIVIGGMNIRRYLFKRNFPVVYPLNWFNKIEFENLSFYYLPTVTNSHRYVVDKNVYLPGSFLIHDNKTKATIFYSGHSAYSNHFLQIKSYVNTILRRENIDLSILPIGIYKPKELYAPFHMSPEQAIQSHLDLKSKASLGVGMDVFCLGGENYNEATTELSSRLAQYEHERKEKINFVTLQPGHSIIL
ncbi:conserved Plasmodium protein, unknown function [Plasmodium knowlesi strain H]|uniref:Metallo-beta-lactamase domain-containing protein n=3 Tax=Plasmodium knowlesi TaxID=5850 RepID=A0A5E7X6N7_PLAKH|nr:N-acyl-phosphatidylethanolamine-hydrolyzing phospholipase D, putative [Plasmodium knowlesi strain H]OTN67823.1 Uncharacterized protein PKNOH_S05385600 [Plasmodium knowlesi]CAA9990443.1 N-acyl-phosphatidylethanolamine-hydrolyzing phospholipase D, putative [Plasmodium knowlesi strain H]SBO19649.1 conserved Plasmodium protein, unknown function [Plasmodium knowlesi strain H]SBO22536.1 conserved Plasmodium protein, unknown function [Plasmodium knowlesi strain H]VVS79917.1 N-acyl-phosphatidyletha